MKNIKFAFFDGILQALAYLVLIIFATSKFTSELPYGVHFILGILLSVFSLLYYFFSARKLEKCKKVVLFAFFSFLIFTVTVTVLSVVYLALPIAPIATTDLANGDGVIVVIITLCYFFTTVIFKALLTLLLCLLKKSNG